MSVKKISKQALDKIMAGKVREPATCVIKFYSNTCEDPEDPHKLTWYRSSEIIDFIERER